MDNIINFYKTFNKYKNNTNDDLYYHILPSINCRQYKLFKDNNNIYGFVNWAFLNKEEEDHYKAKAIIKKINGKVELIYGYMIFLYLKILKKLWVGFIIILKII